MACSDPLSTLRTNLEYRAPDLARILYEVLAPAAFECHSTPTSRKNINDPVWHIIDLDPWEVAALDLPIMQRLRRVRQLGMAHLVYPSAQHSRFEHSLGALAAATQMFDALRLRAHMTTEDTCKCRKCVRMAALFHDCGHGAFSHVSERVIGANDILGEQFKQAKTVLDDFFKEQINHELTDNNNETIAPPAAELLSALLLLTPNMGEFLKKQNCGFEERDQLCIAALVLGLAYNLDIDTCGRKIRLDFMKGLISGDIDADKLDYVARDAYFAGIPIAVDVHRLINQLDVASDKQIVNAEEKETRVMVVQKTGISAVEMFIFTRAYLFERIYQHAKIRSAECVLESSIRHFYNSADAAKNMDDLFNLLFNAGGDDYCIGILSGEKSSEGIKLANRLLPRRALALSPQFCMGFAENRHDWTAVLRRSWNDATDSIPNNKDKLIASINSFLDDNKKSVFIDMFRKSALKEDPEIYVSRNKTIEKISKHFDAAQFSAAYQNTKKIIWIYSDYNDLPMVAAAAAVTFMVKFGLAPTDEALIAAKIDLDKFSEALNILEKNYPDFSKYFDELRTAMGETLSPPIRMLVPHLPLGDEGEDQKAAEILRDVLISCRFSRSFLAELDAALTATKYILEHERHSSASQQRNNLSLKECEFQKDVKLYLETNAKKEIDVEREAENSSGTPDFALRFYGGGIRVALELKAEDARFDTIVNKRISQGFHYTSDARFARIGILYVRFRDDRPRRPVDDFTARCVNTEGSSMLIICIGQRTTSSTASRLSAKTKPDTA